VILYVWPIEFKFSICITIHPLDSEGGSEPAAEVLFSLTNGFKYCRSCRYLAAHWLEWVVLFRWKGVPISVLISAHHQGFFFFLFISRGGGSLHCYRLDALPFVARSLLDRMAVCCSWWSASKREITKTSNKRVREVVTGSEIYLPLLVLWVPSDEIGVGVFSGVNKLLDNACIQLSPSKRRLELHDLFPILQTPPPDRLSADFYAFDIGKTVDGLFAIPRRHTGVQ